MHVFDCGICKGIAEKRVFYLSNLANPKCLDFRQNTLTGFTVPTDKNSSQTKIKESNWVMGSG